MTDKDFFKKIKKLIQHDGIDIFVAKNILKELFNIETISADENGKTGRFPDLYISNQTIGFEVTEVSEIQLRDYYRREIICAETKDKKQKLLIKMAEQCNCVYDEIYGFIYSAYEEKNYKKIDLKDFLKMREQPDYNEERFIIICAKGCSTDFYIGRIKKAIEKKKQKKEKGNYDGVKKTFLFLIDDEFVIFPSEIKNEKILKIETPFEKIYYLDGCGLLVIDFKERNVNYIKGDFLFKYQKTFLIKNGITD